MQLLMKNNARERIELAAPARTIENPLVGAYPASQRYLLENSVTKSGTKPEISGKPVIQSILKGAYSMLCVINQG